MARELLNCSIANMEGKMTYMNILNSGGGEDSGDMLHLVVANLRSWPNKMGIMTSRLDACRDVWRYIERWDSTQSTTFPTLLVS